MEKHLMKIFMWLFTFMVWLWWFSMYAVGQFSDPIKFLEQANIWANKDDPIQDTQLNNVSSTSCDELGQDWRFTFTRTLCYIKNNISDYLQYLIYFGLTVATALLIWNGFMLVTSDDKAKQMTTFKKNLINIWLGVILIVSFYYIIEVFVSVVNFVWE